jgi:hypothetical protein
VADGGSSDECQRSRHPMHGQVEERRAGVSARATIQEQVSVHHNHPSQQSFNPAMIKQVRAISALAERVHQDAAQDIKMHARHQDNPGSNPKCNACDAIGGPVERQRVCQLLASLCCSVHALAHTHETDAADSLTKPTRRQPTVLKRRLGRDDLEQDHLLS